MPTVSKIDFLTKMNTSSADTQRAMVRSTGELLGFLAERMQKDPDSFVKCGKHGELMTLAREVFSSGERLSVMLETLSALESDNA